MDEAQKAFVLAVQEAYKKGDVDIDFICNGVVAFAAKHGNKNAARDPQKIFELIRWVFKVADSEENKLSNDELMKHVKAAIKRVHD